MLGGLCGKFIFSVVKWGSVTVTRRPLPVVVSGACQVGKHAGGAARRSPVAERPASTAAAHDNQPRSTVTAGHSLLLTNT